MQTKIVYVLVSSENGYFYEQTVVSVTSLRLHNPDAHVVLVVDDRTDATLVGKRSALDQLVTEKIVVPMEESLPNKERSRRLKTNLRNILKGDYLYIDADTIVCESLAEIDSFDFPIGMVWDGNKKFDQVKDYVAVERAAKIGYDVSSEEEYFNGGVMYVKDCPESHAFCGIWHEMYLKSEKLGVVYDQPALIVTNMLQNHLIKALDNEYNCQLFMGGISSFAYAKILHIFNAFGFVNFYRYSSRDFLRIVKRTGEFPKDEIKSLKYPKSQFAGEYALLHDTDLVYYHSALFHIFSRSPRTFRFLEYIAKFLLKFHLV